MDNDATQQLETELAFYRNKATQLDSVVFALRALLQTGKGFSDLMSIGDLLSAFMAVCREQTDATRSVVLLRDEADSSKAHYRVRAFHNMPSSYLTLDGRSEDLHLFSLPNDEGMLWQLIRQGDVFSVSDLGGRPRFPNVWRRWNLGVLKSDIWVPLIKSGQVMGILTLGGIGEQVSRLRLSQDHVAVSQPTGWGIRSKSRFAAATSGQAVAPIDIDAIDFGFLAEIASVAAINIDSTLKYERNSRILRNIKTLYDINQQLASVNDFKQLTIETLASACKAMHAQKANLMLLNPETQRLEIKVVWGNIPPSTRDAINDGRLETRSFALGEGVAGKAAKERKPIRVNHRTNIDQLSRNTVHCILAVPLLYGREVMGAMVMTNKATDDGQLDPLGRFSDDDQQLAIGLADQAAINLHKARLYDVSITDRLTGLKNTRHFEDCLQQALNEADHDAPLSLVVTDIDHFKRFNDTYGHKAGDRVLAETAQLFKLATRPGSGDRVFRYGGEEFCMLMPNTSASEAVQIIDAWRQSVADHMVEYDEELLRVTVSAGICEFPTASSRHEIFERADKALYKAKANGRDQVWVATRKALVPGVDLMTKPAALDEPSNSEPPQPPVDEPASNAADDDDKPLAESNADGSEVPVTKLSLEKVA